MSFTPDRDIPDLSGKVIFVTGGNSGLGKESILRFAKHNPRQIIMGARSQSKAQAAIAEIQAIVPGANITFVEIDLSSFASVKKAAGQVIQECDRLDILLNNAGLMGVDPGLTQDGYEMQFGSNHMGPALLTKLLMSLLDKTSKLPNSDVRVVQLSSALFQLAPKGGILFPELKTPMASFSGRALYGQSKLANLYFIKSLAKRYPAIKCVSLHPGVVKTGITNNTQNSYGCLSWVIAIGIKLFFTSVEVGALGQLWASTGKASEIKSGAYYEPFKKERKANKLIDNSELAEKLWDWTEKEFSEHGL
ncbi:retinol dehydrogenase [Paraphaeosphaeria sporulosa]